MIAGRATPLPSSKEPFLYRFLNKDFVYLEQSTALGGCGWCGLGWRVGWLVGWLRVVLVGGWVGWWVVFLFSRCRFKSHVAIRQLASTPSSLGQRQVLVWVSDIPEGEKASLYYQRVRLQVTRQS